VRGSGSSREAAARIPLGSPIWQDPNRAPHASRMPVRTTVIGNGTLQSLDGRLRQARIEPILIDRSASIDHGTSISAVKTARITTGWHARSD
jgi:hypothetical protein